jgi:hypothetical protein
MKRFLLAVASFGLFSIFSLPHASAQVPVRIRMIAAEFSYYNNPNPNGGSFINSNVGFDAVWEMRRFDYSLYDAYTAKKLAGSGSMIYTPANGGASTSGNFTLNPARNPYLVIAAQKDGVVTLKIGGPHNQGGSNASDSLLSDRTPGLPSIAQIPYAGVFLGGGTVLTESSSWFPKAQLLPNEADPGTAEQQRAGYAISQFSLKSLPQVLPFKFVYDANRDGTVSRIVFFGRVEVSEDAPTVPLTPVDALTLGGYSPPTDGNPPADPPADLTPPDAADFSKWFKDIFPPLSDSIKTAIGKIHSSPAPVALAPAAASSTIVTKVTPVAPFAGSVKIAVLVKPAGTTTTPSFPAKFTENTIAAGTKSLKVVLDSAARGALKSSKACTVFILVKATPKGGKSVLLSKRFSLKATGK